MRQLAFSNSVSVAITAGDQLIVGSSGGATAGDFALARYTPAGALDTTFSGDGIVTTDFGSSNEQLVTAVLTSDHKIMAIGSSEIGSKGVIALARYSMNAELDTTFDADGKRLVELPEEIEIKAAILDPHGRILVLGQFFGDDASGNTYLVSFNTVGNFDSSFGIGGLVMADLDVPTSLTLDAEGRIVIAGGEVSDGTVYREIALERYTVDGNLDATFGTNGKVFTDYEMAADVVSDAQGRLIIISGANVLRYTEDGALDTTFGDNGLSGIIDRYRIMYDFDQLALDSNDRILAVGNYQYTALSFDDSHSGMIAARYLNTGAPYSQLLKNGSFEIAGATSADAADWQVKNMPKAKCKCNKLDTNPPKIFSALGDCSFKLKPKSGVSGKLLQVIDSQVVETLTPGTLTISAWYMWNASPSEIWVIVRYASGERLKFSPTKAEGFGLFLYYSGSASLTEIPTQIKVIIRCAEPFKALIDGVSLRHAPNESADALPDGILPLPPIPLP